MTKYARTTIVTIEKTQAEIEHTLSRYGADQFIRGWNQDEAVLAFRIQGKAIKIKIALPLWRYERYRWPDPKRPWAHERSEALAHGFWEQERRQRWRALLLIIKAKLEAIEAGISDLESEFLAYTMLPDGRTFGEWAKPQLAEVVTLGRMPQLLPGGGA